MSNWLSTGEACPYFVDTHRIHLLFEAWIRLIIGNTDILFDKNKTTISVTGFALLSTKWQLQRTAQKSLMKWWVHKRDGRFFELHWLTSGWFTPDAVPGLILSCQPVNHEKLTKHYLCLLFRGWCMFTSKVIKLILEVSRQTLQEKKFYSLSSKKALHYFPWNLLGLSNLVPASQREERRRIHAKV